jgi:hypothetical protein
MQSKYEPSRRITDFHIAGFAHHEGLSVIEHLKLGTGVELRFEPDCPFDPEAIAIYYEDTKIGYVPRTHNGELYKYLYFGHEDLFETVISMFDSGAHPERQFRVVVKLKDARDGAARC